MSRPQVRLDELFDIARGGSPRPIKKFLTNDPDGINWIKIGDATASGKYIYQTKEKIIPEGIKKSRLVNKGDFLLSNSMSFGRPYIMGTSGCIHDGWLVLSPKDDRVDQDFLYHLLGSPFVFQQFDSLAAGSTVRNLNIDLVSGVRIPLIPLAEQKRIVAILDQAFADIDKARALTEQNLNNARELFESTLQQVFSQRGEGWTQVPLNEHCNIKHGYAFKSKDFVTKFDGDEPIVLTPGNYLEHGCLSFTAKNTKRCIGSFPKEFLFDEGDLTIVMTDLSSQMKILGKPAFIGAVPTLHNQRIGRVQLLTDRINRRYLYYFFRSERFLRNIRQTATGTMVRHTAPNRILSNMVPLPASQTDQVGIAGTLDFLSNEVLRLESIYSKKLDGLVQIKKSVLQKAFSGELTQGHSEAAA